VEQFLLCDASKRAQCPQALKHSFLKSVNMEQIKKRAIAPPYSMKVSSSTESFTEQIPDDPCPPLASKEIQMWNNELSSVMSPEGWMRGYEY